MSVTFCTAIPLGIAAGIYLEEYARKNWLTHIIAVNIANLAGVPSIIFGRGTTCSPLPAAASPPG